MHAPLLECKELSHLYHLSTLFATLTFSHSILAQRLDTSLSRMELYIPLSKFIGTLPPSCNTITPYTQHAQGTHVIHNTQHTVSAFAHKSHAGHHHLNCRARGRNRGRQRICLDTQRTRNTHTHTHTHTQATTISTAVLVGATVAASVFALTHNARVTRNTHTHTRRPPPSRLPCSWAQPWPPAYLPLTCPSNSSTTCLTSLPKSSTLEEAGLLASSSGICRCPFAASCLLVQVRTFVGLARAIYIHRIGPYI